MSDVQVSFLIPSFNHEIYLNDLLESVYQEALLLNETSEIIIIDDCSTDDSMKIIQSWNEKKSKELKILVEFNNVNLGIAATFNKLIKKSQGNFIRLCGSDDILIIGGTQALLKPFDECDSIVCTFGDGVVINEKNEILNESIIDFHKGNLLHLSNVDLMRRELIENWCIAGPNFIVKRDFYKNINYDESLKIEDFDFFLHLLKLKNALKFTNEKVCMYRVHKTNTSKTKDVKKRLINLRSFLSSIEKHIEKNEIENSLKSVKFKTLSKINFLEKNFLTAAYFYIISKILILK